MDKEEISRKLDRLNDLIIEANHIIKEVREVINNSKIDEDNGRRYKDIRITEIELSTKSMTSKFHTICDDSNILTLEDLLKISSNQFKRFRGSGPMIIEQAQDFIFKNYGIKW